MAAGSKQIPPEDTLANLLLTLTALSGEFPTAQISRLPSTGAYQEKILKSLKGEKLLRTYYRDGLRALRLTTAAKKLLADKWPDRFLPYLSGNTKTLALSIVTKTSAIRWSRRRRGTSDFNAFVSVLPER